MKLGMRKTPPVCTFKRLRVYSQDVSVCTGNRPACGNMRVCCRYTRRRPDCTHGGVLNVHTRGFSLLLFSSLLYSSLLSSLLLLLSSLVSFSFSFLLLFLSFSLFHCTHRDEINQTSDSTNQERPCTTRSTESITENCSAECQPHTCGVFIRWRMFTTHATFIVYFRSCSMKTSLANDFAVVRLETKEGTFHYRNISGEEFIFYYSFQ